MTQTQALPCGLCPLEVSSEDAGFTLPRQCKCSLTCRLPREGKCGRPASRKGEGHACEIHSGNRRGKSSLWTPALYKKSVRGWICQGWDTSKASFHDWVLISSDCAKLSSFIVSFDFFSCSVRWVLLILHFTDEEMEAQRGKWQRQALPSVLVVSRASFFCCLKSNEKASWLDGRWGCKF